MHVNGHKCSTNLSTHSYPFPISLFLISYSRETSRERMEALGRWPAWSTRASQARGFAWPGQALAQRPSQELARPCLELPRRARQGLVRPSSGARVAELGAGQEACAAAGHGFQLPWRGQSCGRAHAAKSRGALRPGLEVAGPRRGFCRRGGPARAAERLAHGHGTRRPGGQLAAWCVAVAAGSAGPGARAAGARGSHGRARPGGAARSRRGGRGGRISGGERSVRSRQHVFRTATVRFVCI